MAKGKISNKQIAFAENYIVKFDAKAAALAAGYSPKSIDAQASQLLGNPKIQEYIQKLNAKFGKKREATKDMVLRELAQIALSNIQDYGTLTSAGLDFSDSDKWDAEKARCVQEFSSTSTQSGMNIKFKLYDKMKALEMIGRHLGMFNDKVTLELPTPTIIEKRDGTKVIMSSKKDETMDAEIVKEEHEEN